MGYSIYGGLLFMGAFFTILFLCATVLIIYFKQISEGYEDKERFEMLQKVGMDDLEVKRTINKQILIVFFLPLLGALLHVAMASNMIIKLLEVFWLYNVKLTALCIIGSSAAFTLVYVVVYRLTARTYCKIVKW
jgi:putative ABC transport system permease protein